MASSRRNNRRVSSSSNQSNGGFAERVYRDDHIPDIQVTPQLTHTFRLTNASGGTGTTTYNVTPADLANKLLVMATSSTSVSPVLKNLRLRKVEVWAPPVIPSGTAAGIASTVIGVEFRETGSTAFSTGSRHFSDTAFGTSHSAHVVARPIAGSAASMWFDASVTSWQLSLTLPASSIVDFHITAVFVDGIAGGATAVTGAVVGVLYGALIQSNLAPVGFPQIV